MRGHIKQLDRRLKGVNSSICEQTFSWLKKYNGTLNEMRANRHIFMMHFLAKKHNHVLAHGRPEYLHPYGRKRVASQSYTCQKKDTYKRPSKTSKKIYKKPSKK